MGAVPRSSVAQLVVHDQGAHAHPSPVFPGHCEDSIGIHSLLLDAQVTQSTHHFFQLLGLVLGTLYFGQEATQEGVQNINGGIFLILSSLTFSTANGVINVSFLRRISAS